MSRKFPLLDNFNTQPSDDGKYKFGLDSEKISSIKHLKPVFAFDYVCDDNGDLVSVVNCSVRPITRNL